MSEIKFSHEYDKMPPYPWVGSKTTLLEVLRAYKEDLSPEFILYDTAYQENKEMKYYPLPDGPLIILILQTEYCAEPAFVWTTIRRWTKEKEAYYRAQRGMEFDITVR